MRPIAVLALSAALAAVLTPVVIAAAYRLDWLAYPRSDRWSTRTVALMGGIAIVGTILIVSLLAGTFSSSPIAPAVFAGVVVLGVLGAVDDRIGVNPAPKLVLEFGVAAGLIALGARFGPSLPSVLSVPLTFLWIIGVTNAMNLLDNMDGLAAGTGVVAGAISGWLALIVGDTPTALLSFALAGACLGYLPYNYRCARIFMGDTGSLPLGMVVATISLLVGARAETVSGVPAWGIAVAMLICALPIVDTTLVTISRLRSGRAVSLGGRDHASHRLVFIGLSDTRSVASLLAVALLLGLAAVFGTMNPSLALPTALLGALFGVAFLVWLLMIDSYTSGAAVAQAAISPVFVENAPALAVQTAEFPMNVASSVPSPVPSSGGRLPEDLAADVAAFPPQHATLVFRGN